MIQMKVSDKWMIKSWRFSEKLMILSWLKTLKKVSSIDIIKNGFLKQKVLVSGSMKMIINLMRICLIQECGKVKMIMIDSCNQLQIPSFFLLFILSIKEYFEIIFHLLLYMH